MNKCMVFGPVERNGSRFALVKGCVYYIQTNIFGLQNICLMTPFPRDWLLSYSFICK